ncbi:MAG: glycerophosphodiester phosphodiesterase [Desulfurococcales archaeon ex4484_58]|nr:MAG: glycerophosphodiester phosphodiesterase [Desulfurococcales archaeon ex4484_58]
MLEYLEVKPFAIIGHRGAAGRFPENTLKSIEYAIEIGVDVVKVDVRSTRDGEIIVFHDPDLKRLFNRSEAIKDLDYSWIRENLRLDDQYIPLLSEVLELVRDKVGLFIEIKEPEITGEVIELVRDYRMVNEVAIISFYDEALVKAKQLEPSIVTGLIYYKPPGRVFDAKKLKASIVLPRYNIASEKANSLAHRLGLKVVVWTVNDIETARKMIERRVDGIASDYPDIILKLRERLTNNHRPFK